MKNYLKLFIVVLALPIAFSSCKEDDESPGAALIGTWEEVSYTLTGCIDPDDNDSFTCSVCERLVITANTITYGSDPAESYTATGNTIIITETSGATTVTTTINYTISGTTLTVTFKDDDSDGGCTNTITFKKV